MSNDNRSGAKLLEELKFLLDSFPQAQRKLVLEALREALAEIGGTCLPAAPCP